MYANLNLKFYDWIGYLTDDSGKVTDLEVTISLEGNFKPIEMNETKLHFLGSEVNRYYSFANNETSDFVFNVLDDPNGLIGSGLMGPNLHLRLFLKSLSEPRGGFIKLVFIPPHGNMAETEMNFPSIFGPWVHNQQCPFVIPVRTRNVPYPSNGNIWLINNSVIIKDRTEVISKDIVILPMGNLVFDNSTVIFNSTYEHKLNLTVLDGGNLTIRNSDLTAMNTTANSDPSHISIVEDYGFRYYLWILGGLLADNSIIGYYENIHILSNNVIIQRTDFVDIGDDYNVIQIFNGNFPVKDCLFKGEVLIYSSNLTFTNSKFFNATLRAYNSDLKMDQEEFSIDEKAQFSQYSSGIYSYEGGLKIYNTSMNGFNKALEVIKPRTIAVMDSGFFNNNETIFIDTEGITHSFDFLFIHNNFTNNKIGILFENDYGSMGAGKVVDNIFINTSKAVRAHDTDLFVQDNVFRNPYATSPDNIEIINDVPVIFNIFSENKIIFDSFLKIEASDGKTYNPESPVSFFNIPAVQKNSFFTKCKVQKNLTEIITVPWCSGWSYRLPILEVQTNGEQVRLNPYNSELSIGPWIRAEKVVIGPSSPFLVINIQITYGSFFYILLIFSTILFGLLIVTVIKTMKNRRYKVPLKSSKKQNIIK